MQHNTSTTGGLLQKIVDIQRMEPGKLCVIGQGKGGPYYNLQCRENGKPVSRYVPQEQVAVVAENTENYRTFQALVDQYAQVVIARTREERQTGQKKKTADFLCLQDEEIQQLMDQFLAQTATGPSVLKIEGLIRTALFRKGADIVGYLLQSAADQIDAIHQPAPGSAFKGREAIQCQCLFGCFNLLRNYYYSPVRGGYYPADAALGLDAGHTPALVRLASLEGADETSFLKAEKHLLETGGIRMDARQIQRLVQRVGPTSQAWQQRKYKPGQEDRKAVPIMYVSADGTGVPMRKDELEGRAGKQVDGTAKTRQAYLGCVFTQHGTDEKGRPVRDWASTTYISSMEGIDTFGSMLRWEALRRGMASAGKVVLLIDGAHGLENMGLISFKDAIQIVDFYHAMEHAGHVLLALLGSKEHPDYKRRRGEWAKRLLNNGVQKLIASAREECVGDARAQAVEKELNYFVDNVPRMQYRSFRRHGYFIGSGVIEAGCKTVIGARCKQSGMFWGKPGVEHILALRCINASQRDGAFWKHRLSQLATRNVAATLAA